MKVSEAMTRDVRVANPDETIRQAAKTMATLDAGVLPVGENDHLIGMITDRDIAIRGIAQGKGPKAKVRDVMTEDVKYCFDDQEVEEVTRNMPASTSVYSSNSGVCPGSIHPDGLRMRATLTDGVSVATRPMNSSMRFGLFPAAWITRGLSTSFAIET